MLQSEDARKEKEDARKEKEAELLELMRAEGSANRFRATEYTRVEGVKPARSHDIQSTSINSSIDLLRAELDALYNSVTELKSRLNPVLRGDPISEPKVAPSNVSNDASGLHYQIGNLREVVASIQYLVNTTQDSIDL